MPLPIPNLDDLTYEDLVEEARSLIPGVYDTWTDHNPSDPGITLIELFAWLSEMLVYRANRVPESHQIVFLRLLKGDLDWQPADDLQEEIRGTIVDLRQRYRAVTAEDYKALVRAASPKVHRVKCLPERYLGAGTEQEREAERSGYVSTIIVPHMPFDNVFLGDDGGNVQVDYTVVAGTAAGMPFSLISTPQEFLYLGLQQPFDGIGFSFDTKGQKYGLRVEYSHDLGWAELAEAHGPMDYTKDWTRDGSIRFSPPDDWSEFPLNGVTVFWVRVSTQVIENNNPVPPTSVATAFQIRPWVLQPGQSLLNEIDAALEPRRLLTTRYQTTGPIYAPVSAEVLIARRTDVLAGDVEGLVLTALLGFIDPFSGGEDGNGWSFGRSIYLSEIYQLLEKVAGVDYVPYLHISSQCSEAMTRCVAAREMWHDEGDLIGLEIAAHHLPYITIDPLRIVSAEEFIPVHIAVQATPAGSVTIPAFNRAVKTRVKRHFNPLYEGPAKDWRTDTWHVEQNNLEQLVSELSEVDVAQPVSVVLQEDPGIASLAFEPGQLADVQVTVTSGE